MKHLKGFRTLNRTRSHRKALYINMVQALFAKERIMTTVIKAKEIKRIAEKLITKAKVKSLHNIRIISEFLKDKDILMKLFNEISPRYESRPGGYTRIIKLAFRKGDGAEMAYLELVEEAESKKKKTKKTKTTSVKNTEDKKDDKTTETTKTKTRTKKTENTEVKSDVTEKAEENKE